GQLRAQRGGLLGNGRRRGALHETVEIDTDRKAAKTNLAVAEADGNNLTLAEHARIVDQHAHALHEVAPVAQGLESEQVVFEQRMQERKAPRQLDVDIEGRKRDMQKEG